MNPIEVQVSLRIVSPSTEGVIPGRKSVGCPRRHVTGTEAGVGGGRGSRSGSWFAGQEILRVRVR